MFICLIFHVCCVLLFVFCSQSTSVSPDGKLLAVLGDSPDCMTADPQSGKVYIFAMHCGTLVYQYESFLLLLISLLNAII